MRLLLFRKTIFAVILFVSFIPAYCQPKLTPFFRLEESAVIRANDIVDKDWSTFPWHEDYGVGIYYPDSLKLRFFDGNEKQFYIYDWKKEGNTWFSKVTNSKGIKFWLYMAFLPNAPGKLYIFVFDEDHIGLAYRCGYNTDLIK
jgi:hypothetical protein